MSDEITILRLVCLQLRGDALWQTGISSLKKRCLVLWLICCAICICYYNTFLFFSLILRIYFKTDYYYTNIPYDCGQYTIIFSRATLNCMDVLYCLTPTAEGNIRHPCNSRYRGKMFLYIDHSHIEYLLYYILIVK